ncbi:hypothetical protein [Polaromonas sp. YR568]|uniref:hypothetical protein n=1 Tax=Polaromonas sp. YR568 TaxID=1855301 RepID=UPI00398BE62D
MNIKRNPLINGFATLARFYWPDIALFAMVLLAPEKTADFLGNALRYGFGDFCGKHEIIYSSAVFLGTSACFGTFHAWRVLYFSRVGISSDPDDSAKSWIVRVFVLITVFAIARKSIDQRSIGPADLSFGAVGIELFFAWVFSLILIEMISLLARRVMTIPRKK